MATKKVSLSIDDISTACCKYAQSQGLVDFTEGDWALQFKIGITKDDDGNAVAEIDAAEFVLDIKND